MSQSMISVLKVALELTLRARAYSGTGARFLAGRRSSRRIIVASVAKRPEREALRSECQELFT